MSTILVSAKCHPILLEGLNQLPYNVVHLPKISEQEMKHILQQDVVGMVVATHPSISADMLSVATHLKWIARLGSGIDHIDQKIVKERGIRLFTSPEGNSPSVAEFALGMLLSALRHINQSDQEVRNGIWDREKNRGTLLSSWKIGIIGFGHMGGAFGNLLMQLGHRVYAYDLAPKSHLSPLFHSVSLEQIQSSCDVISLHIDYREGNYHFANRDFFKGLKCKPIFINTSRGSCVDTEAVIEAVEKEQISYACLDVLENEHIQNLNADEKAIFQKLCSLPHTMLTPHLAGVSEESLYLMSKVILDKIKAFYQG